MTTSHFLKTITVCLVINWLSVLNGWAQAQTSSVKFAHKLLAVDANEGIDLADINQDGKLDVVAGRNWYPAPEFTAHPLRLIEDWTTWFLSLQFVF